VDTHYPFFRRASDVRAYCAENGAITSPVLSDTDAYERQVEAFAAAVRHDLDAAPDASDGLEAVRLIEAVARSAAAGVEWSL